MSDKNETSAATVESGQAASEDPGRLHRIFCVGCCCFSCFAVISMIVSISLFAIMITSIVIGSKYLHDCPRQRFIPIFLIVSGVFGLLRGFISCCCSKNNDDDDVDSPQTRRSKIFDTITTSIMLGWNIAGAVWVYSIYNDFQSDDPTGEDYCNGICYKYAFWSIIYVVIIHIICCVLAVSFISCCAAWTSRLLSGSKR